MKIDQNFNIVQFLQILNEAGHTGELPEGFPYSIAEVREMLREIRSKLIAIKEDDERLSENPKELIDRVNESLMLVEKDYPEETKFLNIIISQKLAPKEFYEKIMNLMCDITNVQSGLMDVTQSQIVLSNYVKVLKQIRQDPALRDEAAKFAQKS